MTEYPVIREKPDPRKYFGIIPKAWPGQGNMLCPIESRLTTWDFLPDEMLRCTECGMVVSRDEAVGTSKHEAYRSLRDE